MISSSASQLELPLETLTAPTPQSGRTDKNLVDSKLLMMPDIMFASPGGRGQQGPGLTSMVGPQTPTDWLYEGVNTQAPVSPPPPLPLLTDSSVSGKQAERPQDPTESFTFDTCHLHQTVF